MQILQDGGWAGKLGLIAANNPQDAVVDPFGKLLELGQAGGLGIKDDADADA